MPYTPSTAAQQIAAAFSTNLEGAGFTPSTSGQTVIEALADGMLTKLGYIGSNDVAGTTTTNTTTTYTNVYAPWTINIPVAGTYVLHVDLTCYASNTGTNIHFKTLVDGSTSGVTNYTYSMYISLPTNQINLRIPFSWRQPITFTAGSHTIQLQWATEGTGEAACNSSDHRLFTITG